MPIHEPQGFETLEKTIIIIESMSTFHDGWHGLNVTVNMYS